MKKSPQEIYLSILGSARSQRDTAPRIWGDVVSLDDPLLDKIARNAAQVVVGMLPDEDQLEEILNLARQIDGSGHGVLAELLADRVLQMFCPRRSAIRAQGGVE